MGLLGQMGSFPGCLLPGRWIEAIEFSSAEQELDHRGDSLAVWYDLHAYLTLVVFKK
jgi:hypothetical protein